MQAEYYQLFKNYESLCEAHSELRFEIDIPRTYVDPILGEWKFLNLEIEESAAGEDVAKTNAALHTFDPKNLTLEFFEEKGAYYYRGKKDGTVEVFGKFIVFAIWHRDRTFPFPFIRFFRLSGPEMSHLLFLMGGDGEQTEDIALADPAGVATVQEIGILGDGNPWTGYIYELHLFSPGRIQFGPTNWVENSAMRCSFRRISDGR